MICLSPRFQGEGVAYRGRVLVELETKLGPSSKEPSEDLQSHEIILVQVKREKLCTFLDTACD